MKISCEIVLHVTIIPLLYITHDSEGTTKVVWL